MLEEKPRESLVQYDNPLEVGAGTVGMEGMDSKSRTFGNFLLLKDLKKVNYLRLRPNPNLKKFSMLYFLQENGLKMESISFSMFHISLHQELTLLD